MAATLVIFSNSGQRKDIALKSGINTLGRRPDCDVRIPRMTVSRKHCRIVQKDGETIVQDLGSANGTFVNSQRIMEAVVSAGDLISVGAITFTLQVDGKPDNISPPPKPAPHDEDADNKALDAISQSDRSDSNPAALVDPQEAQDPLTDLEPLAGDLSDSSV